MMILKNGKFYKDGVEVPIEIGNAEQIALIKQNEKNLREGVDINFSVRELMIYELHFRWKCPCCNQTNYESYNFAEDEPDDDDVERFFQDETFLCYSCKSEFELKVETNGKKREYKLILPTEEE